MTLRADAVAYVVAILDEPLATAGLGFDAQGQPLVDPDVSGHLKEPLDAADIALGFVETAEEAPRTAAYMALAEWHVLLRVRRRIALRFDVSTGGDSYRLSQSVAQVERLITDARERSLRLAGPAAVAGGPLPGEAASEPIGDLTLSWSGSPGLGEEYARW